MNKLKKKIIRKTKRQLKNEIRAKWKLTSFLNALNYDTMCSVLWLYLHDPFEVFPMLYNLRTTVFHLNFLHRTKPFENKKIKKINTQET